MQCETGAGRREGAPEAQGETNDGRRAEGEMLMQGDPEAGRREAGGVQSVGET